MQGKQRGGRVEHAEIGAAMPGHLAQQVLGKVPVRDQRHRLPRLARWRMVPAQLPQQLGGPLLKHAVIVRIVLEAARPSLLRGQFGRPQQRGIVRQQVSVRRTRQRLPLARLVLAEDAARLMRQRQPLHGQPQRLRQRSRRLHRAAHQAGIEVGNTPEGGVAAGKLRQSRRLSVAQVGQWWIGVAAFAAARLRVEEVVGGLGMTDEEQVHGKEYGIIDSMSYATRISATLPTELSRFLDDYQKRHGLDTRSAALAEAVRALQTSELEAAYRDLGTAQAEGLELYPADNVDGLEQP